MSSESDATSRAPTRAASQGERAASNREIARRLERMGELLDAQDGNRFRARAYRRAAETLRAQGREARDLAREGGIAALQALPFIGRGIARAIVEILDTGRLRMLERLEGEVCPAALFAALPGLGPTLARRIVESLHLETLEELELAAHDGRLAQVPGMGARRVAGLRDVLDSTLRRRRSQRPSRAGDGEPVRPGVALLLALDARYREGAAHGSLPTIAPRRFNPSGLAWLPVLHEDQGGYHLTALFSNTERAHRLGKTDDWVVIFYEDDGGDHDGQCTVVTERAGPLAGRRVVRGREAECARHYESILAPGQRRGPDLRLGSF